MQACLILLTLAVSPSTTQVVSPQTVNQKLDALSVWLSQWKDLSLRDLELLVGNAILTADWEELVKTVQVIQNVTSQLLIDLQVLKGRQAVGGAVQGGQVFMFLAYLVTIAVFYLVRLQASRSKRRAAAARAGKQSPQ